MPQQSGLGKEITGPTYYFLSIKCRGKVRRLLYVICTESNQIDPQCTGVGLTLVSIGANITGRK